MVQKRPFDAEEIPEVSFKHPKQVGPSNQFMSFAESVFPEDACHIPKTSVEYHKGAMEFETSFPGGISSSSWATSDTSEDFQLEPPLHLPFLPEYFSPERPTRTIVHYEDIYSILLKHPPPKLVSVGPNHQADVPVWDSSATSRPNVDEKLMGTCIIPMPQMELSIYDNEVVGKGRTDCSCEDRGSMRCVRQHIVEAREELMKTIGNEMFANLGLFEMGEQVADKWSEEEEQLFREVVFNSPGTLGKTFWDYLSIAFPLKTKKEIVSYYFNVFMLRRRAEQNRNDQLAIDSDDDEWHSCDGNGIATRDEEEDHVTESPVYQDDVYQDDACHADCHENYLQDNDEYASDENCAVNEADDSKYDPSEVPHFIGLPSLSQQQDQIAWRESFDEEVQDEIGLTLNSLPYL
ncbi:SANT/Myb domain [Sesbania bispinosa]|nr:SANT/Myb domain [Sesbania bispinosa]